MADDFFPTVTFEDMERNKAQRANNAAALAIPQEDDDSARAVRAQQLSEALGVPSAVIYQNLDHYERQAKIGLQTQIIRNNPHLQDYIDAHPMAPKVSADDWPNLDDVSQTQKTFGQDSIIGAGVKAYHNYLKTVGREIVPQIKTGLPRGFILGSEETMKALPSLGASTIVDFVRDHLFQHQLTAGEMAVHGLGLERQPGLTGPAGYAATFSEFAGNPATWLGPGGFGVKALFAGGAAAGSEALGQATEGTKYEPWARTLGGFAPLLLPAARMGYSWARAKPWTAAGQEPPIGIDAYIDQAKAGQAWLDAENLKEFLAAARKAGTRDLDPEMFARFLKLRGELSIGIDSEAVRKLYGETVPMPDDGILGWVPKLEDQLQHTMLNGGDIHVPLADYVAKVEPEVHQQLKDQIRARRDGMTVEEANEVKPIDIDEEIFLPQDQHIEAVDSVRKSAGLQALPSVGERPKFTLQHMEVPTGLLEEGEHEFEIRNQHGDAVGELYLKDENDNLHIQFVGLHSGGMHQGPWGAGARAIADGLEQLKTMFPNAKTISGNRITGARERAAGEVIHPAESNYIKRPIPYLAEQGAADFVRMFRDRGWSIGIDANGDRWLRVGDQDSETWIKPKQQYTQAEYEIVNDVNRLLRQIAPRMARSLPAEEIRLGDTSARAAWVPIEKALPFIVWTMKGAEAIPHEAIHHLRQYGFFSSEEWDILKRAVVSEKWLDKYGVREKWAKYYGDRSLGAGPLVEEAIAEGFKDWYGKNWDRRLERFVAVSDSPLDQLMLKIGQLYQKIKSAIKARLGYEPTFEDVFERVASGEVGNRIGVKPLDPRIWRHPMAAVGDQPELPGMTRIEDRDLFEKGNALGMTKKQYATYLDKIAEQDLADMQFAAKANEKRIAREQTAEWKTAAKDAKDEIEPLVRQRPDIQADRFLREGNLYGEKVKGRPRLDANALTDEQKAALPKDYYTKGGIHPDDAATLFGYQTGEEMVEALTQLVKDRGNLKPNTHIAKLVNDHVNDYMQRTHGDLAENIQSEAADHVLSPTQFDMIHEKTLALADKAGMEMSLTKEDMKRMAQESFERQRRDQVGTVKQNLQQALKAGDKTEKALLDEDAKEAFKQQQAQEFSLYYAKEAQALEKVDKTFNRLTRKYADRKISGVDPVYKNYIQALMRQFGLKVNRVPGDLETEMAETGHGTLKEFIDHTDGGTGALGQLIDERILDGTLAKPAGELTVEEFKALTSALKLLDKAGRDSRKFIVEGQARDLVAAVDPMVDQLTENYKFKSPQEESAFREGLRRYITIGLLSPETWSNRFDRDDLHGPWNQNVIRPLAGAANREKTFIRETSREYGALGEIPDQHKQLRTPFVDPLSIIGGDETTGRPWAGFTRKNLAVMISNMGNDYNLSILAKGLGMEPDALRAWVLRNSTKADWQRAEKLGGIFNRLFEGAQTVYRNIYGEAPPKIELQPISVQFPNGETFTSPGWYHPIIKDTSRTNAMRTMTGQELLAAAEGKDRGLYPSLANGYTKRRTGKIDVLDLTYDNIPQKMMQVIHDTAFRAELTEVAKVLGDNRLRTTIRQRVGSDFVDMFDHWLRDIAGAGNNNGPAMQSFVRLSNYMRTNTIGTLIGFGWTTPLKHGPTALGLSIYETGFRAFTKAFGTSTLRGEMPERYRDAIKATWSGDEAQFENVNHFIDNNSEEVRNRDRQWIETMGGAQKVLEGKGTMRERIIQYGSKPVAFSDMLSTRGTWLAAYLKEIDEGGTHGDASFAGDRAVRRAHGSINITNLPELVRQQGPFGSWLTSLYGFFGTMMQRRMEIAFKLNDAYKLGMDGELKQAGKAMAQTVPMIFATVLWPTLVEWYVNSIGVEDKRPWWKTLAAEGSMGIASSFLFLRDVMHGVTTDQEPSVGLLSTVLHDLKNAVEVPLHPIKSFDREHAGKSVQSLVTALGVATGVAPAQLGRVLRFGIEQQEGVNKARTKSDIAIGLMRGTTKRRVER